MSQENVEIVRRLYVDGEAAYYGRIEALHEQRERMEHAEIREFNPG